MTRDDIIHMAREAGISKPWDQEPVKWETLERFANLVAAAEREACAQIVGMYQIPLGNSAAGEMACEWTYDALKEVYDAIRARREQ